MHRYVCIYDMYVQIAVICVCIYVLYNPASNYAYKVVPFKSICTVTMRVCVYV